MVQGPSGDEKCLELGANTLQIEPTPSILNPEPQGLSLTPPNRSAPRYSNMEVSRNQGHSGPRNRSGNWRLLVHVPQRGPGTVAI